MDNDLNTLATAVYVATDDYLNTYSDVLPTRPASGFPPRISDAELIVLSVMETLLGFTSERRFIRLARKHLSSMLPAIPQQPGTTTPPGNRCCGP